MKKEKSMNKRLFLFAGYNKQGIVDPALVYYLNALSKFGDIILFMDSDCPDSELAKVKKYTIHASAKRHGEYDFGSYKRGYIWAMENLKLSDYDFVYLVNDSVYGPLYPLDRYINAMENMGHDAFGIVKNPHRKHPHIQSWFIGTKPVIFLSKWFNDFMLSITQQPDKYEITKLYEDGFSNLVTEHNHTWDGLYSVPRRGVYNRIKHLYLIGMPFMKKVAFQRHHGGLSDQTIFVLEHVNKKLSDAILQSAIQQYGKKYIDWLLTTNPIKIAFRKAYHAVYKLFEW